MSRKPVFRSYHFFFGPVSIWVRSSLI